MVSITKVFAVALIASVFMIAPITLFADLQRTYEPNVSPEFQDTFDSFQTSAFIVTNQTQDISKEMGEEASEASSNTVETPIESYSTGAFAAIRVIFSLPSLAATILYGIANYLHVPTWYVGLVISLIIVTVATIIISLVFRRIP